jgi:hypothetical protein
VDTAAAHIVSEADLRVRCTVQRTAASSTQGLRQLLGMLVVAVSVHSSGIGPFMPVLSLLISRVEWVFGKLCGFGASVGGKVE